jgi:hypothetical protein
MMRRPKPTRFRTCRGVRAILLALLPIGVLPSFASFVTFASFDPRAEAAQRANVPGELIERTLAIVGNQVITLSDVRTAMALGLVQPSKEPDPVVGATERLVDRLLVLREVQRYAPPEPSDANVEEQLSTVRRRLATPALLAQVLEAGGFTDASVRAWVRDDLRIASYLGQRFAAVGAPGDEEVAAYFAAHREEFDRSQTTLDAAAPIIRERLSAERRSELIDDWIADLRRRTPVVELWRVP